jgi:hypothetical protein
MAKREREKDKLRRRERRRIATQAKFQKKMSDSMDDLARSARTESRAAITKSRVTALKEVWTAKLQLSTRISDTVAQTEAADAATKEYLAAIEKELALPEESKNAESEGSSGDESSGEESGI